MDVQGLGRSDTGLVRANNEDAFIVDTQLGLYAVCDGMGGHAGGEVAAHTAVEAISRIVGERTDVAIETALDPSAATGLAEVLTEALNQACGDIYRRATSDRSLSGMGCTATALLIAGGKAAMAHVGDTRLYLVRRGTAHQISSDHTLAAELVRQGTLSEERLQGHPQGHVLTRALGPQPLADVETLLFDLAPGDRLLLCSDGLADHIPSPDWVAEQLEGAPLEDVPDALVEYANGNGGHDNTTVIAISVEADPTAPVPAVRSSHRAIDILSSSFLFADLTLAQLSRVLERCEARTLSEGEVICDFGEVHDELLVIVSGSLRVSTPEGESAVAGPGHHLGESLVLRPRPVRARIAVEGTANVLALDRSNLVDLAGRRPWLGVALLSRLVERLSGDVDRLSGLDGVPRRELAGDLL